MEVEIIILAFISLFYKANGALYELNVADEEIFQSCPDPEPGTLDIHGLLDLSEFSTSMDIDGLLVSGNQTLVWDIQREDRVQLAIKLLYWDRGTWTSTVFSAYFRDFCKIMYDKNQILYEPWTEHIVNDVQDKCVNVPGTKLILKTYVLNLSTSIAAPLREGRYKASMMLRAFDSTGTERPTRICCEVIGDIFKIRN
ncbi:uncharacterized protein LOC6538142 [Drosophila yakuba]|uniref:Uncharacterized protein n=1 Tax=Drosophila yakuba TaxID=7245 RepID=B4PQP9_DROYA|nr:uncharacterized protein LOC6538142 [Drosophila yakuba]EDW98388.1 uncharacterized protein Dyak_GE23800 [Drosophila yakuba]